MILINGEPHTSIAATDRGLHYGDGVFETLAVHHNKPQFWHVHMERLQEGCLRLGIPPPDVRTLQDEATELCREYDKAVIKIIITRGSGGRGYRAPEQPDPQRLLIRYPWPDHRLPEEGIALRLCSTPLACNPVLAGIKHLNRLEQVIARNEWQDNAIQEGVMCSTDGAVIEGTMSNLFAICNKTLLTPDLAGCGVAGVMRKQVLRLAGELGIPCEFSRIRSDELKDMDELFVTNSIIGIWPVASYEGHVFGEKRLTGRLVRALDELMEQD